MEARDKKEAVKQEEKRIRASIEKFKHTKETKNKHLRVSKEDHELSRLQEADRVLAFLDHKEQ